jgi:hypothetical protein
MIRTQQNRGTFGSRRAAARLRGTAAFGCLSWPACVRGGTACPEPDSFGASLNPCCHFAPPEGPCPDDVPPTPNSDGSYGMTGKITDAVTPDFPNVVPSTAVTLLVVLAGLLIWGAGLRK